MLYYLTFISYSDYQSNEFDSNFDKSETTVITWENIFNNNNKNNKENNNNNNNNNNKNNKENNNNNNNNKNKNVDDNIVMLLPTSGSSGIPKLTIINNKMLMQQLSIPKTAILQVCYSFEPLKQSLDSMNE
jgi:long-subunit acyl-CoA synthetase (AMP-forming)